MPKQPTLDESRMMEELGFKSLKDLEEFLNLPSWGCLDMQAPEENEEDQAESQWQESQLL